MFGKRPSRKPADTARARARSAFGRAAPEIEPQSLPDAIVAEAAPPAPVDPLQAHDTLGEALKAVRHDRGLTLQAVADTTRVRRVYLEAIEDMRLDALPSRPFTIGYIRAYATALGLDPDMAIERFKSDDPVLDEPLRAPVGMLDERDPRVAAFLIGALVIIAAIVLWNVAQRAMSANAPPSPLAPEAATAKALAGMKGGTMELGYPLPAPVESTTPPAYETPGLAAAMGLKADPTGASTPKPANAAPAVDLSALPQTFIPAGKVYDAGNAQGSVVTVQALKPASLIIRGADGSVYFARQLSKGEAFKVPQIANLTLDVSKADDFQVFVYGRSKGVLPRPPRCWRPSWPPRRPPPPFRRRWPLSGPRRRPRSRPPDARLGFPRRTAYFRTVMTAEAHTAVRPWRAIHRRPSRKIRVGNVEVGGDAPITVQSMTNTLTADAQATIAQVRQLEEAGCDIVRVSCPDEESTAAFRAIAKAATVPLVADIHFHYKRGIEAAEAGAGLPADQPRQHRQRLTGARRDPGGP